jgi:hypothetical protein
VTIYCIVRVRRNGKPLTRCETVCNRIEADNPAGALAKYRATVAQPFPVRDLEAIPHD